MCPTLTESPNAKTKGQEGCFFFFFKEKEQEPEDLGSPSN